MRTFLQGVLQRGGNPESFWLGFFTSIPARIDSEFSARSQHYGWDPHPVGWNANGLPLAFRQKAAAERTYPPNYRPGDSRAVQFFKVTLSRAPVSPVLDGRPLAPSGT